MADHYLRASFTLHVTTQEAALMHEIRRTYLDGLDAGELANLYQGRSEAFHSTFPGTAEDPFATFRALFSDPEGPQPSFSMEWEDTDYGATLTIFGDNVDVESLANIIHAVCRSAQPCGFAYAYGCSKLRVGEFGGGYVVITDTGPVFHDTDTDLRGAIAELQSEDMRTLVLAKRNAVNGLDFWTRRTGFGRLADAAVFTPADAAEFDTMIAGDGNYEWLTMPPRFA